MNPIPTKLIVGLVVALILGVGVVLFSNHYQDLQDAAAQSGSRGTVLENTSGILHDSTQVEQQAAKVEVVISDSREQYLHELAKVKRNDPSIADRDARAIDDRLRQLARERRLARERLGRPEEFDGETGSPGPTAKQQNLLR